MKRRNNLGLPLVVAFFVACFVCGSIVGYFLTPTAPTRAVTTTITKTITPVAPAGPEMAPVTKTVFIREGVALFFHHPLNVLKVKVLDATGATINVQEVRARTNKVILEFPWKPREMYKVKLSEEGGEEFETVIYAPDKPSPLMLATFDLGEAKPGQVVFPRGGCPHSAGNPMANVVTSQNSQYAAVSTDRAIYLFNLRTQELVLSKKFDMKMGRGLVIFSEDNKYLIVGGNTVKPPKTWRGFIYVYDVEGRKELWHEQLNDATITGGIVASHDSKHLLVGTSSVEAKLYCFSLETGNLEWSFSTIEDIGKGTFKKWRDWPTVSISSIDSEGKVYITATRKVKSEFWSETIKGEEVKKRHDYYANKVYCLDVTSGKIIWAYPKEGVMDIGRSYMLRLSSTPDGKYVVFGIGGHGRQYTTKEGFALCFEGSSGKILWRYVVPKKNNNETTQAIPLISPDGRYVAIKAVTEKFDEFDRCIDRTRPWLFFNNAKMIEEEGKTEPLWRSNLEDRLFINDISVISTADVAYVSAGTKDEYVLALTYGFFSPTTGPKGLRPVPLAEHPYMRCLFLYDVNGKLLSRWKFDGCTPYLRLAHGKYGVSQLADGKYLVVIGKQALLPDSLISVATRSAMAHGVYVFNLEREGSLVSKFDWFYHTEGAVENAAITPDGKYIVAVEVPVDMNPGEAKDIVGSYRVLILA
ncbi:MAG: outer membrane protein assembly factor BamB family protein [Candidatus Hecatellaceae archaeon]